MKTVVLTGEFSIERQAVKHLLQSNGYLVGTNVTESTAMLLVGKDPGSKVIKARSLKVPVVCGETFIGGLKCGT